MSPAEARFLHAVARSLAEVFRMEYKCPASASVTTLMDGTICAVAMAAWLGTGKLNVGVTLCTDTVELTWQASPSDTVYGCMPVFALSDAERVRLALGGVPPVPDLAPAVRALLTMAGFPDLAPERASLV